MAKKGLRVSFFGMVASWFGKANHAYCRAVGQQLHMPWDPLNRGPYTSILSLCVYPVFFTSLQSVGTPVAYQIMTNAHDDAET